jgi:hypothetical protein
MKIHYIQFKRISPPFSSNAHQNQMRDENHISSNQDCNKRDYNIVDTDKKSINSRPKVAQY